MESEIDLHQKLIEQKQQIKAKGKEVSFLALFKYSDTKDKVLMFVGSVSAMAAGVAMPFFMIFFSDLASVFNSKQNLSKNVLEIAMKFFIIGGATWILNFIGLYCWGLTGTRQAARFKKLYYQTLLEQEVAWYDSNDVNKLATEISGNMVAVEGAMGQKISILLMTIVTSIFGFFYAYFKSWRLSLILTGFLPVMMTAGVFMMKAMKFKAQISKISYEGASGIAEQAFGSIKTVKSLVAETFEESKFISALSESQKKVVKYIFFSSATFGMIMLLFLGIYSLGFFYGKQLIRWQLHSSSDVMATFFCFLIGGASVSQITPIFKNIAQGKVAAGSLYHLVGREKTLIEPQVGVKINQISEISFQEVSFQYHKLKEQESQQKQTMKQQINPQIIGKSQGPIQQPVISNITSKIPSNIPSNITSNTVLDKISLSFKKGKVTAIVGQSGSGKSTITQLLMRFYDPTQGRILINDVQMKDIDIKDFRRRIGYVGQEPVLFSMSIAENLRLSNPSLTDQEISDILIKANALQFVEKCENGINTYVGSSGTQLSGGQKQRIAIARAIAKNPYLLVLDEATSALDRKNEKQIQKTLNNLSQGNMTTIVVAHRLSTIKNADHIIVLGKGKILEEGTHNELYSHEGHYFELVKSQMATTAEKMDNAEMAKLVQNDNTEMEKKESTEAMNGTTEKQQEKQQSEQQKKKQGAVFGKLFKQSKGTYLYLLVGCIAAMGNGLIWPGFNLAFSKIMVLLSKLELRIDVENISKEINNYCVMFMLVAVAGAFTSMLYTFCFGVASQRLVYKLRSKLFIKLLNLPLSYYDKTGNTPGAISTKLSQDSFQINNMVTGVIGVMCLNLSTIAASLTLAFYYCWSLTLIVLALSPLMVVTGAINMRVMKSMSTKSEKFQKYVGSLISDTVCNIRTVKSFGNEKVFLKIFKTKQLEIIDISSQKQLKSSYLQGLSRGSAMFVQGITFWIAAILMQNSDNIEPQDIFIAIFSIIFAALGVGQNSQFMPDMGKAKKAGASMFEILDSKDQLQSAQQMENPELHTFQGDISFRNVKFKYPQRDAIVLKNFNLQIKKGDKIGFAGPSGSGKSTITQILMRFYPIEQGQILIDGIDYRQYNLHQYRKQIGLVSQQPTLFLGTAKQNIIYNYQPYISNIGDKVQKYCKIVHADDFIKEWPQKYEKDVGQKGSQVSGGQKQRLALARCLIRQPKIMMLDESTSALDADTQQIVFNNLKPILKNCTCISIAHRLSTIEDSTRIVVMRDGEIIEEGNYDELISKKQFFYQLAKGIN